MNTRYTGLAIAGLLFLSLCGCADQVAKSQASSNERVESRFAPKPPLLTKQKYETDEGAATAEYDRRVIVKRELIATATELCKKANSQKHADLLNFFIRYGRMGLPTTGDCMVVEGPPPKDESRMFVYVILEPEDRGVGQPWDNILDTLAACASYSPNGRTMILRATPTWTRESAALVFLHEDFHAWKHLVKGQPPVAKGDADGFCRGEIEAHEYIGELTKKVYPGYAALISKIASKIGGFSKGDVIIAQSDQSIRREIDAGLPAALGREINDDGERSAVNIDVWYLANFLSIEKRFSHDKQLAEKTRFVRNYLEQTGSAQWLRG